MTLPLSLDSATGAWTSTVQMPWLTAGSSMADSKTVFYLDIGRKFLKANGDGGVTLMPDMLHLSQKGYQRWARRSGPCSSNS